MKAEENLGITKEDVTGRVSHNHGRGGRPEILCKGIQSGKKNYLRFKFDFSLM